MIKSIGLLCLLAILVSCKTDDQSTEKSWQTALSQKKSSFMALDVRTPEEISKNPANGSINIPIDQLESNFDKLDKSKKILVFCEAGGRASRAKKILQENGFKDVQNIGSWRDWNTANQKLD